MVDRDVGRVIGEQPTPVEQTPVEQPETTAEPVRVKRNRRWSRSRLRWPRPRCRAPGRCPTPETPAT